MYEIELKAHVYERQNVIEKLNSWAEFIGTCHKIDTYWKHSASGIQIRLRQEQVLEPIKSSAELIVTYKRKALKEGEDGAAFEVNEEHEFTISNRIPFECFLSDAGFFVELTKEKKVSQWRYENALLELCSVPPLGDFLEIEIMTETQTSYDVALVHKKQLELLKKSGLSRDNIEPRYYSEMLKKGT